MRPQRAVLIPFLLMLASCASDAELEKIANQLNEAVNRCVIDVRDKSSTYETSDIADPSARSQNSIQRQEA